MQLRRENEIGICSRATSTFSAVRQEGDVYRYAADKIMARAMVKHLLNKSEVKYIPRGRNTLHSKLDVRHT